MSFQSLSKFQKKLFAHTEARGPTPDEVARYKAQAAETKRRREIEAAYKALNADDRKPDKSKPMSIEKAALIGRLATKGEVKS